LALGRNTGGGPPKFGGMSHDVVENKGRKKFIRRKSHDIDENKRVNYFCHDVYEKKVVIGFLGQKIRFMQVSNDIPENNGTYGL
jgi:hypothetical protein